MNSQDKNGKRMISIYACNILDQSHRVSVFQLKAAVVNPADQRQVAWCAPALLCLFVFISGCYIRNKENRVG